MCHKIKVVLICYDCFLELLLSSNNVYDFNEDEHKLNKKKKKKSKKVSRFCY